LLIGFAQAGRTAGLWPVASEQTGTLLPALAGASGMAATLAYFYAAHFSMLAVAAVLVSLYPGVTVLLARLMLYERFSPAQRAGLGCAPWLSSPSH
jgi:drug/metabolite transporter (DMT)-like permease